MRVGRHAAFIGSRRPVLDRFQSNTPVLSEFEGSPIYRNRVGVRGGADRLPPMHVANILSARQG
jgi:hypothetical protein